MAVIQHKMSKTIHLKCSGRDGIRQISKTLFSLWSLIKENAQINRITRHREECGLNKNCNYQEVADGNKMKGKVKERNILVVCVDIVLFFLKLVKNNFLTSCSKVFAFVFVFVFTIFLLQCVTFVLFIVISISATLLQMLCCHVVTTSKARP